MGLLYNNKKKQDLVVLGEQKLENDEGKEYGFVLIPDVEEGSADSDKDENKG